MYILVVNFHEGLKCFKSLQTSCKIIHRHYTSVQALNANPAYRNIFTKNMEKYIK